jgi:hypothetical protein
MTFKPIVKCRLRAPIIKIHNLKSSEAKPYFNHQRKVSAKTANVTKPIFALFQCDWRGNVNVRVVALEEIILFYIKNIY